MKGASLWRSNIAATSTNSTTKELNGLAPTLTLVDRAFFNRQWFQIALQPALRQFTVVAFFGFDGEAGMHPHWRSTIRQTQGPQF
jgi:hypothetical protein